MASSNVVKVDMTKLLDIERRAPGRIDKAIAKLALTCQAEIVENFSASSPSSPGQPPGVDTGALRASVHTEKVKAREHKCVASTEYAIYLEYGTLNEDGSTRMAARPFMLPAVERTKRQIGAIMESVIEG